MSKRHQEMSADFYDRLEQAMKDKHINAYQLSQLINVSPNTVSEWINKKRIMNVVNFFDMCRVLDVDPLWLYKF